MCTVAGTVNIADPKVLDAMLTRMAHRGPDDQGVFLDRERGVFLGHRRLSIIDLSAAGHQPMSNAEGSVWVAFNGELYNYKPLTEELKGRGYAFASSSDTEVLVHGYEADGPDIFKKIDGMWAIALYDKGRGKLFLSRDPAGIKPLYLYRSGTTMIFASEIAAIAEVVPKGALTVRAGSVHRFLSHGYLYGTETIYNEIVRVGPGELLTYDLATGSLDQGSTYAPTRRFEVSGKGEASEKFEELFAASVRSTLQADVPVGLFLSGGIDSALVGDQIKRAGSSLRAFTVGFEEASFDESSDASRIARHLGFPHEVYTMRASDVANDLERIIDSFGEPFADTSALPTYYVSKCAREHGVKVVLAGDGADELFGGYPTHYVPQLAKLYRLAPATFDAVPRAIAARLPARFSKLGTKEKMERFLHGARAQYEAAHAGWKHVFTQNELRLLLAEPSYQALQAQDVSFDAMFSRIRETSDSVTDEVMKVDFQTFLPGSCLVKSDIMSMQHGLEVRLPFLTKDIIDFAWFLPTSLKASPFRTKKLLRGVLARRLPSDITSMRKQGFVPPLSFWLTKELKSVMTDILCAPNVAKTGFLHYNYIASLIDDHLARRADNTKKIWTLMSLVRFYSKAV